jgi:hypothetical protein
VSLRAALWAAFFATVVVAGIVLLRACGLGVTAFGWNFCPSTPPALSAEAERGVALARQARTLELELAQKRLECASLPPPAPPPFELPTHTGKPVPQQTALLKPPPPPPEPPKPPSTPPKPLDSERWAKKDLSLLEGCWRLGRQTVGRINTEECAVPEGRICFGAGGTGRRETSYNCRVAGALKCEAPITSRFNNDGTLSTTQPKVTCSRGMTWNERENWLNCRRVSDTLALCRDGIGFEHEFRR